MTGILLVTHSGLGETLRHQAEIILGRDLSLTTISVDQSADMDQAQHHLIAAVAMSADAQGVLVLTDLPGATPHNLAVRAAGDKGAPVVSGLNLPMLLKVINHADQPPAELARLASIGGQQGIVSL